MQTKQFTVNDKPFHAITAGNPDAPLMLFLHGFPEYSGAWAKILPHFIDGYYCVAPDQRGYGQSWRDGDVNDYTAKHLTKDVIEMIDLFGKGRAAVVVGHDWGAAVAYACAMHAPDKVDRLIIANGVHPAPFQTAMAAGGAQSSASQYINWLRKPGSEQILAANGFERLFGMFSKNMDMDWLTEDVKAGYHQAWRDEAGVRAMVNWYRASPLFVADPGKPIPADELPLWDRDLLRIRMPHLLLWGMNDTALLPESHAGLGDFCDDLTIKENDAADHWIIHQHPDWVVDQIKDFLTTKG